MAAEFQPRFQVTAAPVTCPICVDLFQTPKSLPCGHTFCLKCLQRQFLDNLTGDEVPCPLCRKEFQIPENGLQELPINFIAQDLIDAKEEISETKTEAFLEPRSRPNNAPHQYRMTHCSEHAERQLQFYCLDCKRDICAKCLKVEHKMHKWDESEYVKPHLWRPIEKRSKSVLSGIEELQNRKGRDEIDREHFILGDIKTREDTVKETAEDTQRATYTMCAIPTTAVGNAQVDTQAIGS